MFGCFNTEEQVSLWYFFNMKIKFHNHLSLDCGFGMEFLCVPRLDHPAAPLIESIMTAHRLIDL